ncbi:hypothetical protein [Ideonella sp. YS5]|uniref:hypothetical protein n=1 Tax=Ideonella sp. YS5 TaxID=3453714 RepID=UPI003EEB35BC
MTIKKIAFEVQCGLRQAHGIDIKRSHAHEVLAALFGYASYAALTTQQLLAQHDGQAPAPSLDLAQAAARAFALGYEPPSPPIIAAEAARATESARLMVVSPNELLAKLGVDYEHPQANKSEAPTDKATAQDDRDADQDWEGNLDEPGARLDLASPVLRESLLRMADAGSALAHLALAQLDEESIDSEPSGINDGRYWFEQQQSGRVLTGVELEWAEAYRDRSGDRHSRDHHWRRAAALGSAEAALRIAEEMPSDDNFELAARVAGARHANRLGQLALRCERLDDARKWFRVAAESGNTDAMKLLASELETDLKEAWTWVHLAELLSVNVMEYHAVGEVGLPADSDEAGPIYAAGGFELDRLPDDVDEAAKRRARELYKAIRA